MEVVGQAASAAVYGLFTGCLYAVVALGIVLIFKSTRQVNFAHGTFAVLGGFVFLQLSVLQKQPAVIGVLAATSVVAIAGLVWGRIGISMERRSDDLVPLIGSLGLYIILDALIVLKWGGNQPYLMPSLLPVFTVNIAGSAVDAVYIWLGAALVVIGGLLVIFFRWTDIGLQMRAAVQNREAAELIGIRTQRLALLAWVVGSLLGLIALLIYMPMSYLQDFTMQTLLISAFGAASVGGFESFSGAVVGAFVIGVTAAVVGRFVSPSLESVVSLLFVVVIMFANPRGVFVVRGERR
jgi:branched-chain amino acid transport system permease protein